MTTKQSTAPELNKRQVKFLRGLGHKLPALVLIGKEGITDSILKTVEIELKNHELLKVKIGTNSSVKKDDAARVIPEAAGCNLVQLIGKTLLLYKKNPKRDKEKRIVLPK